MKPGHIKCLVILDNRYIYMFKYQAVKSHMSRIYNKFMESFWKTRAELKLKYETSC